ncbi:MAG TPA: choice-of-anchor J domain-containing protein [Chitinophagaceae bacterium]
MRFNLKIFSSLATIAGIVLVMISCEKDYKNESAPTPPTPPVASWTESFTDHAALGSKGWVIINNTDKPGPEAWRRGRFESTNKAIWNPEYVIGFPAYKMERSPNDFISVDMYAGAQVANMSVWLITPITKIKNGDELQFYTRAHLDTSSWQLKDGSDRMQVRANYTNTSTDVGSNWTTVGNFTTLMVDINPGLVPHAYPQGWTKYTLTVSGVTGTINGRFAFRYFVQNGGPDGLFSSVCGVDEVSFVSK